MQSTKTDKGSSSSQEPPTKKAKKEGVYVILNEDCFVKNPGCQIARKKPKDILKVKRGRTCEGNVVIKKESGAFQKMKTGKVQGPIAVFVPHIRVLDSGKLVVISRHFGHESSYRGSETQLSVYETVEGAVEDSLDSFFDEHYFSECDFCENVTKVAGLIEELREHVTGFRCSENCEGDQCECRQYLPSMPAKSIEEDIGSFCYEKAKKHLLQEGHCGFRGAGDECYDYFLRIVQVK